MGKPKIDLTGQRFGRLVAIEYAGSANNYVSLWKCVCDCGAEHIARLDSLRSGGTTSCGCYKREIAVITASHIPHTIEPNPAVHLPNGVSILALMHKGRQLPCYVNTVKYDAVKDYHWTVAVCGSGKNKNFYAQAWRDGKFVRMHNLLMPGVERVDHENFNGLDNRYENLRPATSAENLRHIRKYKVKGKRTTSKYKGVSFEKRTGRWVAALSVDNKTVNLGRFRNEEDAAIAYNAAARQVSGEFAVLNELPKVA